MHNNGMHAAKVTNLDSIVSKSEDIDSVNENLSKNIHQETIDGMHSDGMQTAKVTNSDEVVSRLDEESTDSSKQTR